MNIIMRKLICLLLVSCLALALTACGNSEAGTDSASSEKQADASGGVSSEEPADVPDAPSYEDQAEVSDGSEAPDGGEAASSRILVVYFSRTGEQYTVGVIDHGNTAIVAEMIADETGADLFEVIPADDRYPMTYEELTEVAKQEQNEQARPAYAGEVPDLSQYDVVFLGAPVWWGDWPMIMYTFFEENAEALAGRTLVPFSTHEGSGLSGFDKKLSSAIPGSNIAEGLAIRGHDAQNDQENVRKTVNDWIKGLGIL